MSLEYVSEIGTQFPNISEYERNLFTEIKDLKNLGFIFRNFFCLFTDGNDRAIRFSEYQRQMLEEAAIVNRKRKDFVEQYRSSFRQIKDKTQIIPGYKDSFGTKIIFDLKKTDLVDEVDMQDLPIYVIDGNERYNSELSAEEAYYKFAYSTFMLIEASQTSQIDTIKSIDLPLSYKTRLVALFNEDSFLGVDSEIKLNSWMDYLNIPINDSTDIFDKQNKIILWKQRHSPYNVSDNYTFLRYLEEEVQYWGEISENNKVNKDVDVFDNDKTETNVEACEQKKSISIILDDSQIAIDNELYDDEYEREISRSSLLDAPEEYAYNNVHPKEREIEESTGTSSTSRYKRDPGVAKNALAHANYKCEIDPSHDTFIRKNSNIPYTESHHLIPMMYSEQFKNSLDHEVNVVSLCSNCHNRIHYGKDADKLIKILYNQRSRYLEMAEIGISEKDLLRLYGYN